MALDIPANYYAVLLYGRRVGTIRQRGDFTAFRFNEAYIADPNRPVLGLAFEQKLGEQFSSALRLPPWFSNLLPEGVVRNWIAQSRAVSADREMELLAEVGHDLPGAVRVVNADEAPDDYEWDISSAPEAPLPMNGKDEPWRVSLAGVHLKLSMVAYKDRLTLPGYGDGDDWIVKFPDPEFREFPRNEFAVMSLASAAGIDVPAIRLVHRDEMDRLPDRVWRGKEEWAFAIRRFDRGENRDLIHIEDLAQVRSVYPHQKYEGSFETIASLVFRRRNTTALQEFSRRLAFSVLVTNGDAHLKNWSLIYRDQRRADLAPAYDLMSTAHYREVSREGPEDLGLKFDKTKRLDRIGLASFARLERRLGAEGADLERVVEEMIERAVAAWPKHMHFLDPSPQIRESITASINERRETLLRNRPKNR